MGTITGPAPNYILKDHPRKERMVCGAVAIVIGGITILELAQN
jgi:hypothetical protein